MKPPGSTEEYRTLIAHPPFFQHLNLSQPCARVYIGIPVEYCCGFSPPYRRNISIRRSLFWMECLSLGSVSSRQHIWSFACALGDGTTEALLNSSSENFCPCSRDAEWPHETRFVRNDYFCDTGNHNEYFPYGFYSDDLLWDGAGCGGSSTCCQFNNPPWFLKTLPQPTTDDLEVRTFHHCRTCRKSTSIQIVELYIQL